jgi:spore coat protein U-like protein
MLARLNLTTWLSARWIKQVALLMALLGCGLAPQAWAACNVSNSNISLGSKTGFELDNSGTNSSGTLSIRCSTFLSLFGQNYVGIQVNQPDNLLRRVGGTETIPFILSWTANGDQIPNGVRNNSLSTTFLALLSNQSGSVPIYARTANKAGLKAGTYHANVTLTWYYSVCNLAALVCLAYENSPGLTRVNELGAINEYGSGVTATMTVELVVTPDCALTVPTVNFGQAALPSQFPDRLLTINARCTAGHAYTIGIDNGQNPAGSVRRMKSGSNYLAYDLWKGQSGTERWGTGSGNWRLSSEADDNPALNGIQSQGFRFRAQVRPDQAVRSGLYQDMLTVSLDY